MNLIVSEEEFKKEFEYKGYKFEIVFSINKDYKTGTGVKHSLTIVETTGASFAIGRGVTISTLVQEVEYLESKAKIFVDNLVKVGAIDKIVKELLRLGFEPISKDKV